MMTLEQVRNEIAVAATRIGPKGCGQIEYATLVDMQIALNAHLTSREVKGDEKPVAWRFVDRKGYKFGWNDGAPPQDAIDSGIRIELAYANHAVQEAAKPSIKLDPDTNECSPDPVVRKAYADGYDVGYAHGKGAANPFMPDDVAKEAERYRKLRAAPLGEPGVACIALPRSARSGDFINGVEADAAIDGLPLPDPTQSLEWKLRDAIIPFEIAHNMCGPDTEYARGYGDACGDIVEAIKPLTEQPKEDGDENGAKSVK